MKSNMLNQTCYLLILSTFLLTSISDCSQQGNKEDLELKTLSYFLKNIDNMNIIDYSGKCNPNIHAEIVRYPKRRIINALFASEPFEFYKFDPEVEIGSEYTGVEKLLKDQSNL